jgi:hypothetical protein
MIDSDKSDEEETLIARDVFKRKERRKDEEEGGERGKRRDGGRYSSSISILSWVIHSHTHLVLPLPS